MQEIFDICHAEFAAEGPAAALDLPERMPGRVAAEGRNRSSGRGAQEDLAEGQVRPATDAKKKRREKADATGSAYYWTQHVMSPHKVLEGDGTVLSSPVCD